MKTSLHISASFDKPDLLVSMVERLAYRTVDMGYAKAKVPSTHSALETSSLESYVTGDVHLTFGNIDPIHMPFISGMLFTCIKEKGSAYKLNWCVSLN